MIAVLALLILFVCSLIYGLPNILSSNQEQDD